MIKELKSELSNWTFSIWVCDECDQRFMNEPPNNYICPHCDSEVLLHGESRYEQLEDWNLVRGEDTHCFIECCGKELSINESITICPKCSTGYRTKFEIDKIEPRFRKC